MSWQSPAFILAIIAMSYGAWIFTSWIRARHGYPIETGNGGLIGKEGKLDDNRKLQLLETENGKLKDQLLRLEDRLSVLERIATDPAERTAREIDALRSK